MAKELAWKKTKTLFGNTKDLKLFKDWFEYQVFTKAKVNLNHFYGSDVKPEKGATQITKAYGMYITDKGDSKQTQYKKVIAKFKEITKLGHYKTWGYADLKIGSSKSTYPYVVTIERHTGPDKFIVLSLWDGDKDEIGGEGTPLYVFKIGKTTKAIRDPSKKDSDKVGTIKIDTAQQELISLAIFKAVLSSSNPWNNFEDMYDDKGKNGATVKSGLKQIHSGLKVNRYKETDWWQHFDRQFEEIIDAAGTKSGLKTGHYEVYNRDGTGMKQGENFMDYISKLIENGTEGSLDTESLKMFAKKDSWNPADIWLLDTVGGTRTYNDVKKDLEVATTVPQVNTIMQKAFHDKVIKGISLKKNRGGKGQLLWDEVNLFPDVKGQKASMPEVVIKTIEFDPHYNEKTKAFSSVTSNVILTDNNTAGRTYKLTFRSNQSYMTDITYEFGEANMPAQLGKVPKDRFNKKLVALQLPGISGYPKLSDSHTQTFSATHWATVHPKVTLFLGAYDWKINMSSRSDLKHQQTYKAYKEMVKASKPADYKFEAADIVRKEYKEALAAETEVNKTKAWAAFIKNLKHSMGTKGNRRVKENTVMMQMVDFIYLLAVMQETMNGKIGRPVKGKPGKFERFMTELFYWAQKKGQEWDFGPFGKSY